MNCITFDLQKTAGRMKPMNGVNNGPTEGGIRGLPNNFDAYKAACIPYARNHDAALGTYVNHEHIVDVHRIFKNFDADENDPKSYVFLPTDRHLQTTVDAGTKPFYRLGPSIEHYYKDGTYPPKDYEKWARICEHIIMHYNEGWADGFHYGIEYWEIWCEPDVQNADGTRPLWQGTEEEFIEFWAVAAKYLKKRFPHLKFGGPSFARPVGKPFFDVFFSYMQKNNVPIDFYSWHRYCKDQEGFESGIVGAREIMEKYGYGDAESICAELNYNAGIMMGETFARTVKTVKSLKGASFMSMAMCVGQALPLDMLLYYDARPCVFNGMFATETYEILKGYYPFLMFRDLKELGTYISVPYSSENVYSCGATDNNGNYAFMVTYYDDNDDAVDAKELCIEFKGNTTPVKVSYYLLDERNNNTLQREEIFTAETFRSYIKADLYATHLIKVEKFV